MEFREMKHTDIHKIWSLFKFLKSEGIEISFADVPSEEVLATWVSSDCLLTYVAVQESEICCVVRGKREDSPEKRHAVFLTAATAPTFRGQGLAASLTDFALRDMAEKHQVKIAHIYVYSDNLSSLKAVAKMGFEHAGTVKWHHYDFKTHEFVDDLIFHKYL